MNGWSWGMWVGGVAGLMLLTHCGGGDPGAPLEAPVEAHQEAGPGEDVGPGCIPRPVDARSYCTYSGTGGGLVAGWKHYGGRGAERLWALDTDAQGGFVVAGLFGDVPFPNEQGLALARYAADGSVLWSRTVTTARVRAEALKVTPEGNILVVGTYDGAPDLGTGALPAGGAALFIAKFSPSGRTTWSQGFVADNGATGGARVLQEMRPTGLSTDAQGSLIVVGRLHGRVDFGGGTLDAGPESIIDPNAESTPPGGFVVKFDWRGTHVWSRVYTARAIKPWAAPQGVSTDAAGNVFVGGRVSQGANLGDGPVSQAAPFLVRYTPTGTLSWKRLFPGFGSFADVQALPSGGVAFSANLNGEFPFAGGIQRGGEPPFDTDEQWSNTEGFVGTLNAQGSDGWIRDLGQGLVDKVVAGGDGTVTVSARGRRDLGGGTLGGGSVSAHQTTLGHYSPAGQHLWSRALDGNFRDGLAFQDPGVLMAPLPGGALQLGGDFFDSLWVDGTTHVSRGEADLFYLRLNP